MGAAICRSASSARSARNEAEHHREQHDDGDDHGFEPVAEYP
jgi:hypothetical protein